MLPVRAQSIDAPFSGCVYRCLTRPHSFDGYLNLKYVSFIWISLRNIRVLLYLGTANEPTPGRSVRGVTRAAAVFVGPALKRRENRE